MKYSPPGLVGLAGGHSRDMSLKFSREVQRQGWQVVMSSEVWSQLEMVIVRFSGTEKDSSLTCSLQTLETMPAEEGKKNQQETATASLSSENLPIIQFRE